MRVYNKRGEWGGWVGVRRGSEQRVRESLRSFPFRRAAVDQIINHKHRKVSWLPHARRGFKVSRRQINRGLHISLVTGGGWVGVGWGGGLFASLLRGK